MAKVIKVMAVHSGGQKPDFTWAREGDVFDIPEDKFSARWMRKVEEPKKAPAKAAKADE